MSRVADSCESSGCGVGGASLFARSGATIMLAQRGSAEISWDVAEIRREKAEHSVSEVWSPIPDFSARVTLSEPSIPYCAAQWAPPVPAHLRPTCTATSLRSARLAAPSAFV